MKESEFTKLEEALAAKHYHLKKEWLKTCVEFVESNGQKSLSFQTILNEVVHQFLNSDISKCYEPPMKIPPTAAKLMISKKMIFQIVSHLNISNSIYEQLGEATKDTHDLSWFHGNQIDEHENEQQNPESKKQNKKRGLLKIELSDGVNKVWGIEYAEDVFVEDQLVPGAKILLLNKVKCRKGLLFLDRSNCQFLGGRVEELGYDIVEKFAKTLKIDLDAEKNRRKLARENATEVRRIKRDKQHKTQSSISPFLVKKNRFDDLKNKKPEIPAPSSNKKAVIDILEDSFDDIQIEDLVPKKTANNSSKVSLQNPQAFVTKRASDIRPKEAHCSNAGFEEWEMPDKSSSTMEKQKNEEFEKAKLNNSIDEWSFVVQDSQPAARVLHKSPVVLKTSTKRNEKNNHFKHKRTFSAPPKNFNSSNDVVGKTCTFSDIPKKSAPMEDINVFKPKVKQLPRKLLEESSPVPPPVSLPNRKSSHVSSVNPEVISANLKETEKAEIYQPGKLRSLLPNESISWKLKKIKNEMEESRDDDFSDIMPPGFIQKETFRSANKNTQKEKEGKRKLIERLTRDIHGPRNFKKPELKKVEETKNDTLITNFFNTVKSLNSNKGEKGRIEKNEKLIRMGIVTPVQKPKKMDSNENYMEIVDQEHEPNELDEDSDDEFEKMLQQVRNSHGTDKVNLYQEPTIVHHRPKHVTYSPPPRRSPSPQILDTQASILDCTMESDGRRECERWKVGNSGQTSKRRLDGSDKEDFNDPIQADEWNPTYMAYKMTKMEQNKRMEPRGPRMNDQGFESGQRPIHHMMHYNTDNFRNRPGPSNIPYTNEDFPNNPMIYNPTKEVAVIRQSMNVQHYKTPLSKRIPSAENPKKYAEEILTRFSNLNIISLRDALVNRKYWMMSKIVVVMPTSCQQVHELQSDGIDWQLKMKLSDTSISDVFCLVSTDLLDRIFGFSVNHCKKLFDQSKLDELRMKKMEAEKKLHGFKRLDLVIWIEVSPQFEKNPIIVDVKTVSDAINIL